MLVFFHVLVALGSLVFAGYMVISPSQAKLRASYWLTGFTLLSGSYLVVRDHAHILSSCLSGLIYLCFSSLAMLKSRQRLAVAKINIKEK